MKKLDKKFEHLFKKVFSSYQNLALFLLAITIALSLPLAYSLLNHQPSQTSRVTAFVNPVEKAGVIFESAAYPCGNSGGIPLNGSPGGFTCATYTVRPNINYNGYCPTDNRVTWCGDDGKTVCTKTCSGSKPVCGWDGTNGYNCIEETNCGEDQYCGAGESCIFEHQTSSEVTCFSSKGRNGAYCGGPKDGWGIEVPVHTACASGFCNSSFLCADAPGSGTGGGNSGSGGNNSGGGNTGGGSVATNLNAQPLPLVSGTCSDNNYSTLLSWTGSGNGWYADISEDQNFSGWSNRNVSGLTSTSAPDGFSQGLTLEPDKTYYWRVWNGQAHSSVDSFSVPSCSGGNGGSGGGGNANSCDEYCKNLVSPSTGLNYCGGTGDISSGQCSCSKTCWPSNNGGNNGGSGGGSTNYTFTATLDKTTYAPNDTGQLCYNLDPQNVAYDLKLTEGPQGGSKNPVEIRNSSGNVISTSGEFSDNGVGGGDCIGFTVDAQTGSFEFLIVASKEGSQIGEVTLPYTVGDGSGGNNGGNNGGNTQYTLTTTLDKTTYAPGENAQFCYTFTPQGTAFGVWQYEAQTGGTFSLKESWQDDGSTGGSCRAFTANSQIGQYEVKTEATIGSTKVEDIISYSVSDSGTGGNNGGNTSPTGITTPPTGQPQATATNTPVPNQPTATNTPAPSGTLLTVGVSIPGIGPDSSIGQNSNPVRQTITAEIAIFDVNANQIKTVSGSLNYGANSYGFVGDVDLGDISDGAYTVKIRVNNSLWKAVTTQISENGNNVVETPLVTGDIDQNNRLDLIDYNAIISCYGGNSCSSSEASDLNIDGTVDEKDLNILYNGFASRQGD